MTALRYLAAVVVGVLLGAFWFGGSEPADSPPDVSLPVPATPDATIDAAPPELPPMLQRFDQVGSHASTRTGFFHQVPEWIDPATNEPNPAAIAAADTPYHAGMQPAPTRSGVTVYDPAAVRDGVNLVVSAHAAEASLMDMRGNTLHTWAFDYRNVWPEPPGFFEWQAHKSYWRRVHVYPNGDLLAIFEGVGMIKLDADSNLLWRHQGREHHDIEVAANGDIFTLARRRATVAGSKQEVLEDHVLVLTPEGKLRRKFSIPLALQDSPFRHYLRLAPTMADFLHTNTIEILDGTLADKIPAFRAGNLLVAMRNIDVIGVIDPATERFVWAMSGMWHMLHHPTVLASGNMLVFDNLYDHDASAVIEFDPVTKEVVWSYCGTADQPFFSWCLGSCQRLDNGNTLITSSVSGRVFEVTRGGDIVWEWINPHRAGDRKELIATLCDVVRLDWAALDFPQFAAARERARSAVDLDAVEKLLDGKRK